MAIIFLQVHMSLQESLQSKLQSLHFRKDSKHIFICCSEVSSKCCPMTEAQESWEYLKKRVKELKLDELVGLQRTRAGCLRVCMSGPIAVVYPEGVWYHSCSPKVLDLILQEHILKGIIVKEYQINL